MRPREPALIDRLKDIVDVMRPSGIPVVANGDCLGFLDASRVRTLTGGVPSVFVLVTNPLTEMNRRICVHDRPKCRSQSILLSLRRFA